MDEKKAEGPVLPEIGSLWVEENTTTPCAVVEIGECGGLLISIGGCHYNLDTFYRLFQPYTIIAPEPTAPAPAAFNLDDLVQQYAVALATEAIARMALADARVACKTEEARATNQAYENGIIRGGNAEARKAETAIVLADDDTVSRRRDQVDKLEVIAIKAENARKIAEAGIGLAKAMLYSQSGKR